MSKGFLCISRYAGQRIFIGSDIVIRINEVGRDRKVQLCIECPKEIKVDRPTRDEDKADRAEARKRWQKKEEV